MENAQKKLEGRNFDIRKQLLEYDDVMNRQREVIYGQRQEVLTKTDHREAVLGMTKAVLADYLSIYCSENVLPEEWDLKALLMVLEQTFFPPRLVTMAELAGKSREELALWLEKKVEALYEQREAEIGAESMRELERVVLLRVVDSKWMEHLDAMDELREGIGLRAYGQRDPLIEYKLEAHEMFQGMVARIQEDTVRYLFKIRLTAQAPQRRSAVRNVCLLYTSRCV